MDVDSLEFVLQGIAFGTHGFVAPVCHIFRLVNGGESTIQLVIIRLQDRRVSGRLILQSVKNFLAEEYIPFQNIELIKIMDGLYAQQQGTGGIGLVIDAVLYIGQVHAAETAAHGLADLIRQIADDQNDLADPFLVQHGQGILQNGGSIDFGQTFMGAQGPGLQPGALARY